MPLPRLSSPLRIVLWSTAIAAAVGATYSQMQVWQAGGQTLAPYDMARGALTGAVIGGVLTFFEVVVLNRPLGAALRQAPFTAHVPAKTLVYLGVILFALKLSGAVFPQPGQRDIERGDVLFSLAVTFVFVFILDLNTLLGQNVLLNFITGRYYRPRLESRVFLFLDMQGSTGLAERLGPLDFHRLLNWFVLDLTEPIVAARGEIHRYVGDELIATWKLKDGIASARCIEACFGAMERLARRAPDYAHEFGASIAVRAGLHCGPVVAGEMGSVKKEIVFLGDTVNTAARIQELCRETGERVIASAELIDRLELPGGIIKRPLGGLRLRGKGAELALYTLTKTGAPAAPPQAEVRDALPARDGNGSLVTRCVSTGSTTMRDGIATWICRSDR